MEPVLLQYQQLDRVTWTYISSLMTIALYFKFSRLWSVRNLDLVGLILISPGVLLISDRSNSQNLGYIWLFVVGLLFLVRLLADPVMVRRPLLEPNLSPGGLAFMSASLLALLLGRVMTTDPPPGELDGPQRLEQALSRRAVPADETALERHGPAYGWLQVLGVVPSRVIVRGEIASPQSDDTEVHMATVKTVAVLCQLAIISGLILIGFRHFGNLRSGVAAVGLYLLVPYTALAINRLEHMLPAALLVWLVALYRRPLLAGVLLGLAAGVNYYPIFLLPLWISFYWQRGLVRFLTSTFVTIGALVASLALTSDSMAAFGEQVRQMFVWAGLLGEMVGPRDATGEVISGLWSFYPAVYRVPVFVLYCVLCGSLALWPAQKNLGTLLSCSAAVMLGTQFWDAHGGGQYIGWYLPLLLLTILRPNLEDRVALSVLGTGWSPRRSQAGGAEKAA